MSTQKIARWELDWTFGDRLRKARRVIGINVEQLAETVGVSKAAVSQWETGATTPRSVNAVARRIELAYGIPAAWLLGQETPTQPEPDGGISWAHRGSNSEPAGSVSVLVTPTSPVEERDAA